MGHKSICLSCKIAFSNGNDPDTPALQICPLCSGKMTAVNQKFKPPKKTDIKGWKVVAFLVGNGFTFNPAYQKIGNNVFLKANYPKTLGEAEEFIKLYKER